MADQYRANQEIDWGDEEFDSEEQKTVKVEMLKFQPNTTYRIRLASKPYKFFRHYSPRREGDKGSPIQGVSPGKDHDVVWQGGFAPSRRYAAWVIDRVDGKLKVMEFGSTIFKRFKSYKEIQKKSPGGENGPDWVVKVKGSGMNTEYELDHQDAPPYTDEEKAMINEMTVANNFKWTDVRRFRPETPETIAKWFEESKNLAEGDPVPGSFEYNQRKWEMRKAQQESASNDGVIEGPAQASVRVDGAYKELFNEGDASSGDDDKNVAPGELF